MKFVVITLALIIVVLLLRNTKVFAQVIKAGTEFLGQAFAAVTDAEGF